MDFINLNCLISYINKETQVPNELTSMDKVLALLIKLDLLSTNIDISTLNEFTNRSCFQTYKSGYFSFFEILVAGSNCVHTFKTKWIEKITVSGNQSVLKIDKEIQYDYKIMLCEAQSYVVSDELLKIIPQMKSNCAISVSVFSKRNNDDILEKIICNVLELSELRKVTFSSYGSVFMCLFTKYLKNEDIVSIHWLYGFCLKFGIMDLADIIEKELIPKKPA